MGGSSKKVTAGYRYYLGMHMILCHGPIDRMRKILVDGRTAWQGDYAGGRINVRADNLFGGESREGGVSGAVDIEMGGPSQGVNDYLAGQLGSDIPAFRGVVGAVLRQCYFGINPYLKKWAFLAQRIHTRQNGVTQWYDAKAQIGSLWKEAQAIQIALDNSGSMAIMTSNGKTRYKNAQDAISSFLDSICERVNTSGFRIDICLTVWADGESSMIRRAATASDFTELKAFLNSFSPTGIATNFYQATKQAFSFFSGAPSDARRSYIFVTDGEPNPPISAELAAAQLDGVTNLSRYAFNIDLEDTSYSAIIDNTPSDGVPVIADGDPDDMIAALTFALDGQLDMNPAHIIRECLTDPDWGMGYQEIDIDDDSFRASADKLFSEGMGISLLWDRQIPLEDFIKEILRHIDATVYVDRGTGKFVLKLIRKDYIEEDLVVIGPDNAERVEGYSRPAFGELVNSVTVNYWDSVSYGGASITADDPALIQMQGAVIATTIQYPGFTGSKIAAKAAMRDLKSLSIPRLSCTIYANKTAKDLNIGDPFLFEWPDYHEGQIVMRVTGLALGDGKTNKIRISCTQDTFDTPDVIVVTPDVPIWQDPSSDPTPAEYRIVVEAPYFELVQRLGQTTTDDQLASNNNLGYILASAVAPTGAINGRLAIDSGAGYDGNDTAMDFCPAAFLAADITPGQTSISITGGQSLSAVTTGTHAQIGNELVKVVALTDTILTAGRGVLDTVPAAHEAGTPVMFWDEYADSDDVEYVEGEVISVKILPTTGKGTLNVSIAPVDTLQFSRRAVRPYPPGNFRIGGEAYPVAILGGDQLSASWSHRDRLQQTAGELQDTTVGDIGPEAGTTYNLQIYGEEGTLLRDLRNVGTSYTYLTSDELGDSLLPSESSDIYWLYVSSLMLFNGADGSTTFADETGKSWSKVRNAQIDTSIAKFNQSLELQPFVEAVAIGTVGVHLHFDGANGSTSFIDALGSGAPTSQQHVTTAFGDAAISTAQSKFNGASLRLDGTGDYLSVADVTPKEFFLSNNVFTIECWVRFDNVSINQAIACCLHQQSTPYKGWVLRYDPTQTTPGLRLVAFKGDVSNLSDVHEVAWTPSADTWYHLRVCRSGNTVYYFVNGVLLTTKTLVNASIISDAARPMLIGAQDSAGSPNIFFQGYIDELRVLNGTLLGTTNFTPQTEPYPSRIWGDMLEAPAHAGFGFGTGDFTIEAWVYLSGGSTNHVVLDLAPDYATAHDYYAVFFIDATTGKLSATMNGSPKTDNDSTSVSSGAWHHVAWARSSGVLKAFLNGVQQWSLASAEDLGSSWAARVGHSWRSNAQLAGRIDDLRVTKGVARYTGNFTPPASELQGGGGGGLRLNGRLRLVLQSERGGLTSYQAHDYTVLREGYGFNYGELYGGT